MSASRVALAGIVPAGGRARRFGSDKTLAPLAGATLLGRAVGACRAAGADPIVVVGPEQHAPPGTLAAREEPPFGGPVAALAAGLARIDAAAPGLLVAVVAADMPFAETALPALIDACVSRAASPASLRSSASSASPGSFGPSGSSELAGSPGSVGHDPVDGEVDGAWAVDAEGRRQPLLAVYRAAALRRALVALGDPSGAPMRAVTRDLRLVEVTVGAAAIDIDTPAALARAGRESP